MKVIIILDQIQAGLGGKEHADTPLGGKKMPMGSADNVEKALKNYQGEIIGTFYCGTDYYQANRDLVQRKFAKMAEKMEADVVILGPAYDYPDFSQMACEIADYIQSQTKIPALVACAKEKNEELIEKYHDNLVIVKMPPKGGTGLSDSIEHVALGCDTVVQNHDVADFKAKYCY
ncbi:GrdB-related putative oxidoreductase [Xylocopilactobacillus apicola]|uniref:Proline reductase n=1 Tax=Xylocopilactobacillus apicola TaxID=2932184 RepID=A0AAU9D8R9_9LACO|nr:GrdB-related putative oxidoreductase [Xylocopilactobacillus apicola]BDR58745.1 proline reductase [Xylocopilactobacillus apicola]